MVRIRVYLLVTVFLWNGALDKAVDGTLASLNFGESAVGERRFESGCFCFELCAEFINDVYYNNTYPYLYLILI